MNLIEENIKMKAERLVGVAMESHIESSNKFSEEVNQFKNNILAELKIHLESLDTLQDLGKASNKMIWGE